MYRRLYKWGDNHASVIRNFLNTEVLVKSIKAYAEFKDYDDGYAVHPLSSERKLLYGNGDSNHIYINPKTVN